MLNKLFFIIIFFVAVCTASSSYYMLKVSSESPEIVEPNSDFMLKISLENLEENSKNVGGKYLILQKDEFSKAIKDSLPSGFVQYDEVRYNRISKEIDLSSPIRNTMLLIDAITQGISLIMTRMPQIDAQTPLQIYGYSQRKPTTTPEFAAEKGEKIINNTRETAADAFEYRMRTYGFYLDPSGRPISGKVTREKITDGIAIPPLSKLIIEIPLRAPAEEGEYILNLKIPYLYTTTKVSPLEVSKWDGHIAKNTATHEIKINVKKENKIVLKEEDILMTKDGKVVVNFKKKVASFENEFCLFRPVDKSIFKSTDANIGKSFYLGSFPAGTRLIFSLKTPEGYTYYTDPSLNPDGCDHVIKKQIGSNKLELSWEDLYGLGDKDYDDVVVEIEVV